MPLLDVSPGELLDRLTILELKLRHVPGEQAQRRSAVQHALDAVRDALKRGGVEVDRPEVAALTAQLHDVNAWLWDLEDEVRRHLGTSNTGDEFVQAAAAIPRHNDARAMYKARIDALLGHAAPEVKVYGDVAAG